jgi:hypothetical protein
MYFFDKYAQLAKLQLGSLATYELHLISVDVYILGRREQFLCLNFYILI